MSNDWQSSARAAGWVPKEEHEAVEAQAAALDVAMRAVLSADEGHVDRRDVPRIYTAAHAALAPDAGRSLLASHASAIAALTAMVEHWKGNAKVALNAANANAQRWAAEIAAKDSAIAALTGERAALKADVEGFKLMDKARIRGLTDFEAGVPNFMNPWPHSSPTEGERADGWDTGWYIGAGKVARETLAAKDAAWRTVNAPEKHADDCPRRRHYGLPCTCGEHARRAEARKLPAGESKK
jgi:hypothetical protein